ncbi:hypothetical protein J5N97_016915 [Dioscorea zingiberensis]|uniref:BRI1 kinase inhibitor 1 n=1 Tax=Dioscorea zingiberensis TaxID=325984 RepID=A0A9D5CMQ7_9LILI|nr:hypothetical protein J5N97_016915 [Dioscorea zingiberensis]
MESQEENQEKNEDRELAEEEDGRKKLSPSTTPTLPPSCTSSPSNEFSFTISLHPSPNSNSSPINYSNTTPSMAITLPPSFFTSISPRPSDFSIENLSFSGETEETQDKAKPSSFTSFLGFAKWLPKRSSNGVIKDDDRKNKKKMKMKFKVFDIARVFKRYMSVMESLFFFKREKERRDLRRRPYSFSGKTTTKNKDGLRSRRRECSAPVSMRASPANSGLLVAAPTTFSSTNESTMEELQSAIQAAIAHCKNSVAIKEDECKC